MVNLFWLNIEKWFLDESISSKSFPMNFFSVIVKLFHTYQGDYLLFWKYEIHYETSESDVLVGV